MLPTNTTLMEQRQLNQKKTLTIWKKKKKKLTKSTVKTKSWAYNLPPKKPSKKREIFHFVLLNIIDFPEKKLRNSVNLNIKTAKIYRSRIQYQYVFFTKATNANDQYFTWMTQRYLVGMSSFNTFVWLR